MSEVLDPGIHEPQQSLTMRNHAGLCALLLVLALPSALHVTQQVLYSPDSYYYLDIAKTLAREGRFATYHLNLNTERIPDTQLFWPPLYPLCLAGTYCLGATTALGVRIVTVIAIVVSCIAGYLICSGSTRPSFAPVGFLTVLISISFLRVYRFAWSEPLFIACTMLYVWLAIRYVESGTTTSLSLVALMGAICSLCRDAGLFLLPFGLVPIVLREFVCVAGASVVRVALRFAIYSALFMVVSGAWLGRNLIVNQSLFGPPRPPATADPVSFKVVVA